MSLCHGKTNRRILPRWRTSTKASQTADFVALKSPSIVSGNMDVQLRQVVDDFAELPTVGTAAEALSFSLLAGRTEAAQAAAKFVISHETESPYTLLCLAKSVVEDSRPFNLTETSKARQVAKTRGLLRINPDNALYWSDMARHYASLGHKYRAHRCMTVARHLAPDHRWMLRTAARFLVHQDDPVGAHKLLASHPRTRRDPWLIAAELACAQAAGRAPRYWRQATDILKWDSVSPLHISELATAVAMMELEAGEHKRARKYVQKGLVAPTENTLAQVSWANESKHLADNCGLDGLIKSTGDAYEAECRLNTNQGDLLAALRAAQAWEADEPFAARPCSEAAYIGSLLDDYDLTVAMAAQVARLDGRPDANLEMNSVFATLSSGKLTLDRDAVQIGSIYSRLVRTIERGGDSSYHAMANLGLWLYRYGDATRGRQLYEKAITNAQKVHLTEVAALAATFAAREAILAKDPSASSFLIQAKQLAVKSKNKASAFYLRKLDALFKSPENASEILSPASAPRFLLTESYTSPFRVEKTDNGLVLWVPKRRS